MGKMFFKQCLLLVLVFPFVFGISTSGLFPFGAQKGDKRLVADIEDVSSSEFYLETPITLYDQTYNSVYINSNGLLSFLTDIPNFFNIQFPLDYPVIAPFYSDVDTRGSGSIFYRESQSLDLLEEASEKIRVHFSVGGNFKAKSLLVVTWDRVGYYNSKQDQVNTYQVAVASDGLQSYAFLLYADIQWIYGEGKSPNHPDARAQVGFMSGEGKVHLLVGSGTDQIRNLHRISNVGERGVWMFRIGKTTAGDNILEPDLNLGEDAITVQSAKTCVVGAAFCHRHAKCIDYNPGYCCECIQGYYGNGKNCLQNAVPQRLNGKVNGMLNDERIEDADLHTYIVTNEGRAYTAISRIPSTLGFDMQVLLPIGGIVGWLFALPQGKALNGYRITDGIFNHTMDINFPQTGHNVKIEQKFLGLDVFNHLRVTTDVHGSLPSIPFESRIEIEDSEQEFTRVSPGLIRSNSKRSYHMENSHVNTAFTVDQTITYDECLFGKRDPELNTLRLKELRNYVMYDPREQVIRYAVTDKISPLFAEDPCKEGAQFCGQHSSCIVDGDSYKCVCDSGYEHLYEGLSEDTAVCVDINECKSGKDNCHSFAECLNQLGSFLCRCLPGYTGDGVTCTKTVQVSCTEECDENADCIQIGTSGHFRCQCRHGFEGNGVLCIQSSYPGQSQNCRDEDICDPNADCVFYSSLQDYQCQCLEGYKGNGLVCVEEIESCDVENNCHQHASCLYEQRLQGYFCVCNPGYRGDGYHCISEAPPQSSCNIINDCHPNALCIYDTSVNQYSCRCNAGFQGDGHSCTAVEVSCDEVNICSIFGRCVYDSHTKKHVCRCNADYEGDGINCSPIDDCQSDDACDINAQCLLDSVSQRYRCKCNYGYSGNGKQCTLGTSVSCQVVNNCDPNAHCVYDSINLQHHCQCTSGYQGDGYVCVKSVVSCNIHNNCHPNADCSYDTLEQGYRCQCQKGYTGDGFSCVPAHSCFNDPSVCHPNAECIRHSTLDHYLCQCRQGYRGDGYICNLIPVHEGNFLLINQGMATVRLPITASSKDQGRPLVLIPHQTAVGIDVDCTLGKFYWTDIAGGAIREADYDGSNAKTFIDTNLISPECIAVDWVSRNVFWTDSGKDTVEVAKLETRERKVLFSKNLVNPRGIAVHPGRGTVYWSDWERTAPKIEVGSMDGTMREIFVGDNLGLPNSLTIDFERDDLCWADAGTQKIECIGLHGHNRRTVIAPVAYPFGLANNRDTLFWTDWDTKSIQSASKAAYDLNKPITSPLGGNSKLYGIVVVPERCPRVNNLCAVNNGGCKFLCLPNRHSGRTCMCPDYADNEDAAACNEV